jgi:cyclophilin family peptidyl-prolyl cis-trans isomerase
LATLTEQVFSMLRRYSCALILAALVSTSASAQTVRFETTVGNFDMVLNPTHNAQLQGNVDNFLHYVNSDSYRASWINRAAQNSGQNFVLQMGGFYANTLRPSPTIDSTRPIFTAPPVTGAPGIAGLSNTVGTVAMALSGNGNGGTNRDSGTSSFFINLASNTFLDPDFTVFAMIPDMTTVNKIMALTQVDKTQDANYGAGSGNLAYSNIPLQADGKQVFILSAAVISDAMQVAADMAGVQSTAAQSASAFGSTAGQIPISALTTPGGSAASAPITAGTSTAVPEPASLLLAAVGALGLGFFAVRRRRG